MRNHLGAGFSSSARSYCSLDMKYDYKFMGGGMLKVKEAFVGANGAPRGRTVAWRVSLVALILLAGSVTFALLNRPSKGAHAGDPPAMPVSTSWYFAEGRVGGGFREYLTLGNPDPTIDCTVQIEYLAQGSATSFSARKPMLVKTVVIPHASRYTASVNTDLGVTEQQSALLLSALVTVPTSACTGIVAERPMYFNYRGVQSGSDIMGASHLGSNFYFADVPTMGGSSSFMTSYLSILNPPTGSLATVTATYYAAGHQVGMQQISVAAGSRGTILPDTLHLPSHVAAVISSDQPVVVERSSYLYNMHAGIAGMVSSANSLLGAPMLYNNWLFAEGYTGGQTQEDLILSNLKPIDTTATIVLEYQNGHHQSLTMQVGAYSQVVFDVNAANMHPTGSCDVSPCSVTPEVSAEVTATSTSLVVERDMFFHYTHTVSGTSSTVMATGGSAVTGAMVATTDTANFAEGYTNTGYNEWLTLQNPTMSSEQVRVTLLNEYGRSYTQIITIRAKSRSTADITMLVKQHLVQSGDDARAYQVSMSVKAVGNNVVFVAERPMYFHNGSGIQGGTGVIGYNGLTPIVPPFITEHGSGITTGSSPDYITTGPDGNVWFTEYDGNRIGRITPDHVVTEFSAGISGDAEFGGITAGPDGNVWFTEENANRIGSITPDGVVTEFSSGLHDGADPAGIVAGADGNLWFTEYYGNRIGRITPQGVITEFSAGLTTNSDPNFIENGPDGNLWFTENNADQIGRITTTGVVTEFSAGINAHSDLQGIVKGPDGNLWFADDHNGSRIGRITPAGVVTEFGTGITPNSGVYMLTVGSDGNLWFTEENSDQIGRITPQGVITEFSQGITPSHNPDSIVQGPDGNLWFTEYDGNEIGIANMHAIP